MDAALIKKLAMMQINETLDIWCSETGQEMRDELVVIGQKIRTCRTGAECEAYMKTLSSFWTTQMIGVALLSFTSLAMMIHAERLKQDLDKLKQQQQQPKPQG